MSSRALSDKSFLCIISMKHRIPNSFESLLSTNWKIIIKSIILSLLSIYLIGP